MTMPSFTLSNRAVNFTQSNNNAYQGTVGSTTIIWEGMALFLEQNEENNRTQNKTYNLAKSKGIDLPAETVCLPEKTIEILFEQNITPDFINPSQDSSLIIEFNYNSRYHMVEFYDDGEIIMLTRGNTGRNIWTLNHNNYFERLIKELSPELEPSMFD